MSIQAFPRYLLPALLVGTVFYNLNADPVMIAHAGELDIDNKVPAKNSLTQATHSATSTQPVQCKLEPTCTKEVRKSRRDAFASTFLIDALNGNSDPLTHTGGVNTRVSDRARLK